MTRIHSVAGQPRRRRSRWSSARSAHRTTRSRRPGWSAAARDRRRARRASPITACCSSTSCPSSRAALEALRQPLEDGRVAIVRGQRMAIFPTRFMLVAATNPCPCGQAPSGAAAAREADLAPHTGASSAGRCSTASTCSSHVQRPARERPRAGRRHELGGRARSASSRRASARPRASTGRAPPATPRWTRALLRAPRRGSTRTRSAPLYEAYRRGDLSARGRDRILRVARTIADLDGDDSVRREHVVAALGYRHDADRRARRPRRDRPACDACLRRSWLVARLAGRDRARPPRATPAARDPRAVRRRAPRRRRPATARASDRRRARAARPRRAARGRRAAAELEAVCRHDAAYPARLRDLDDRPASLCDRRWSPAAGGARGGDLEEGPRAVAVVGTRRASPDGARGRARPRPRARRCRRDRGQRHGARRRQRRPRGSARGRRPHGRGARRRRRRRLPARARRGCTARSARAAASSRELPPGSGPFRWCFPARNRIIAALAQMTSSSRRRSARARSSRRSSPPTSAARSAPCPARCSSWRAAGTNALLRDGATLVRDVGDVLDAAVGVGVRSAEPPTAPAPRPAPARRSWTPWPAVADTVAAARARSPTTPQRALAALTELELLGYVRRAAGGRYVVVPA